MIHLVNKQQCISTKGEQRMTKKSLIAQQKIEIGNLFDIHSQPWNSQNA